MVPHPLSESFRAQARYCLPGSPLYAQLLQAMADDLDAGGITAQVLAGAEHDRPGTVPQLRLLGALHRLVLSGRAPGLAGHYPSAGGAVGRAEVVWEAVEQTLRDELDELRELVGRTVQTNEPGRAGLLWGGLLVASQRAASYRAATRSRRPAPDAAPAPPAAGPGALPGDGAASGLSGGVGAGHAGGVAAGLVGGGTEPMPVRLLEVGASGGLGLLPDRYGYAVGERVLGDPGSPLVFDQPWIGVPPADLDRAPRIVERRGCDPRPVDTGTDEGRLTLMSYVWADWTERLQRLERALRVAATQPPTVDRAGLADWLAAQLATPRPGVLTVVWHSVMWQYVERPERLRARAVLQAAAAAATVDAPFAYLRFEPSRDEVTSRFELRLTLAPAGPADGRLATAHGHGIPAVWV